MLYSFASFRLSTRVAATSIFAFLAAILVMQPVNAAAAAQPAAMADPMLATKAMVGGALNILRDSQLPLTDKRERLRALADSNLDFDSMARATLGHHWSELTPEQRTRFTSEFKSFIENAYLSKIQDYSGQNVVFTREKLDGAGDGEVFSQWVGNGQEPVQLQFMLHRDNGEWKIYDLVADGVAITSNYRNQFNHVLDNQSFDSLISLLRLKDRQLAASLGKR